MFQRHYSTFTWRIKFYYKRSRHKPVTKIRFYVLLAELKLCHSKCPWIRNVRHIICVSVAAHHFMRGVIRKYWLFFQLVCLPWTQRCSQYLVSRCWKYYLLLWMSLTDNFYARSVTQVMIKDTVSSVSSHWRSRANSNSCFRVIMLIRYLFKYAI